jgi:hypothetical protein
VVYNIRMAIIEGITDVVIDKDELLISRYISNGLSWKAGAITLGIEIRRAKEIYNNWKEGCKLSTISKLDDKLQILINGIDEEKVMYSKLGEIAGAMTAIHNIKRLETGESTQNISIVSRMLEIID